MGIDTNLNIDPYFDDFDETKQFNRILFRPGRAVQARELTQLQTILQNQVERFGTNIFKEGSIIEGVNITERSDIFYVKVTDQSNLNNLSVFNPTDTETYFLVGGTSNLRAQIISTANGFQTRDPDLKTFFIEYLNATQSNSVDIKEFIPGELLTIEDSNGATVLAENGNPSTAIVANTTNPTGRSFGISIDEGIIYQKGHFIFVDSQFIIISKYSRTPGDVSVGFNVQENIVVAAQDSSLLDNAQGYNNFNAPGADRLQLKPQLVSYNTSEEPEDFFAIIRYKRGRAVRIRDVSVFNSIATEMARRTYEESGNYTVRGLNISLEQESTGNNETYAVVSPGKAYVYGYEVNNIASQYLLVEPATKSSTKSNQGTGVSYGSYFEYDHTNGNVLDSFRIDGTRYDLYAANNDVVGSCSVKNVTPGKIFVYAVEKLDGQETTPVSKIQNTPLTNTSQQEINTGAMIFDTGRSAMKSVSDFSFVRRFRRSVSTANSTIELTANNTFTPLTTNVFAVDATNNLITGTASSTQTGIEITLDDSDPQFVYFDALVSDVQEDSLSQIDIYIRSTVTGTTAPLGIPNAVKLLEVKTLDGSGNEVEDVTNRFSLVNNQKDGFYDLSYLKVRTGETVPSGTLQVKVTAIRRTSSVGSGYLTVNSYSQIDASLLSSYTAKNGAVYRLTNSIDFRPYATPTVPYSLSKAGAGTATVSTLAIRGGIAISNNTAIRSTEEFYLGRIDSVVVDSNGTFSLVKGNPAEAPTKPNLDNVFELGEIYVPGNVLYLTGDDSVEVKSGSTQNYTMKDIEGIEKAVNRLVETVSLSMLETDAMNLYIPDDNGIDRFKNGIIVDSFNNLSASDFKDPEYKAAIDRSYTVAMPAVKQFPVDLRVSQSSSVNTFSEVRTISDTGTRVEFISQPYATTSRNCVSSFYTYKGKTRISPQFEASYDTLTAPVRNVSIDSSVPSFQSINNIQDFLPLTLTSAQVLRRKISKTLNQDLITYGGRRSSDLYGTTLGTETSILVQDVGNFVTDITYKPYVKRQEIKILVTGLRPNTRHYFYFEETNVDAHVYPGTVINSQASYDIENVRYSSLTPGTAVRSDSNGVLAAIFVIPPQTFFVGELSLEISDSNEYENIRSNSTSYSRTTFRAYNFGVSNSQQANTTRTEDYISQNDVESSRNVTTRLVPLQTTDSFGSVDPIAQTFFVKKEEANNASALFVSGLKLYFKQKSLTNGIVVEIREVEGGYPSSRILPFARKHLKPNQVFTSENGSTATPLSFDNPVKLSVEKEYAIVLIPDANDPDYAVFTSKVGQKDLALDVDVTQDWGDGVLFASTNTRAWKPYRDEDMKFSIERFVFNSSGTLDLVPDNYEFFTLSGTTNEFFDDEIAYIKTDTALTVGISNRTVTTTTSASDIGFAVNDYVLFEQGSNQFISYVVDIYTNSTTGYKEMTIAGPSTLPVSSNSVTATLLVAGRVSFFNGRKPTELHIKQSAAREDNFFAANNTITGFASGATAQIESVDNIDYSFFQPMIYVNNVSGTNTDFELYDGITVDKSIQINDNVYSIGNLRNLPSKSRIVDSTDETTEDFMIRVSMSNNETDTITPVIDDDLSMLNVYQYHITDNTSSSSYVSKQVILQENMEASGLRVVLNAFRPIGTYIDVYARFSYPTNSENLSDWIKLDNNSSDVYSNLANVRDYREMTYTLDEDTYTSEFSSFQIKIVMRLATSNEISDNNLGVTPGIDLFPHIYDYRAIAVT